MTRQMILSVEGPETDKAKATIETFSQMTLQAVRDEDYALVATDRGALHSGANEPAVQHYHKIIAELSSK